MISHIAWECRCDAVFGYIYKPHVILIVSLMFVFYYNCFISGLFYMESINAFLQKNERQTYNKLITSRVEVHQRILIAEGYLH